MIAWLIEKEDESHPGGATGRCLGCLNTGKSDDLSLGWTTPDFAIRFARKEDAEKSAMFLAPGSKTIAVEHVWDSGPAITTKNGLLYRAGKLIELPEADHVARNHGFVYAEQFVASLQAKEA